MSAHKETFGGEWLKPFADALGIEPGIMGGLRFCFRADSGYHVMITTIQGTPLAVIHDLDVEKMAQALGFPPYLQELTIEVDERSFVSVTYRSNPDADLLQAAIDVLAAREESAA